MTGGTTTGAIAEVATGPVEFGIIGASWRAEYFLRVAAALPDRFTVRRVLARTEESARAVTRKFGVPATTDARAFAREQFEFVVVSVPREIAPDLIADMVADGIPVLAETPPAATIAELDQLYTRIGADAPVQVAEQYRFQPQHEARLAAARPHYIGPATVAQMSIAHGYHGISMLRTALSVGFDPVSVIAAAFPDHVLHLRGRDAWEDEPAVVDSPWTLATLRWGDRTGVYEFNGMQYFSPIRARSFAIRGERGEVLDDRMRRAVGPHLVTDERLVRQSTGTDGDLEGMHLQWITAGDQVLYRNPFTPARLNDDELAVASCLARMTRFIREGIPFYGLADGCHDQYLALLVDEAAATGRPMQSERRPWSDQQSFAAQSLEAIA